MNLRRSGAIVGLSVGLFAACSAEKEASNFDFEAGKLAHAQQFESADYVSANESIVVFSDMAAAAVVADSPNSFKITPSTACDFTTTFYQIEEPTDVSLDIDGTKLELTVSPNGYDLKDSAATLGRLIFEGPSSEFEFSKNEFVSSVYTTPEHNYVEVTEDVSEPAEGFSIPNFGIRYLALADDGTGTQKYFGLSSGYFVQPEGSSEDFANGLSMVTGDCRQVAE